MATNKQLFSIQKHLSSSAVDRFKLERVFEVNKAKTPKLYNDIVNDVQFLENNGLFILIDGANVQVKYANGIKVWSDALTLVGVEEPVTASEVNLDGYEIGTEEPVADTDTLLEAIGKLEARIVALETAGV